MSTQPQQGLKPQTNFIGNMQDTTKTPETDAFFTAYNLRGEGNIGEFARRLERERDELRVELENIAKANPREWGEMSEQFQAWAQNRARTAIAKAKGSI